MLSRKNYLLILPIVLLNTLFLEAWTLKASSFETTACQLEEEYCCSCENAGMCTTIYKDLSQDPESGLDDEESNLKMSFKNTNQTEGPIRIVFACKSNSCRSQMAEGWARKWLNAQIESYSEIDGAERSSLQNKRLSRLLAVEIYSAGLGKDIKEVKIDAITAMKSHKIDIKSYHSKAFDGLLSSFKQQDGDGFEDRTSGKPINHLVVLCSCGDQIRDKLDFHSDTVSVWNIEAPSAARDKVAAFARVSLAVRDQVFELLEDATRLSLEEIQEDV